MLNLYPVRDKGLQIAMKEGPYHLCSCFFNFPHNYILLLFCITVKHNTCLQLQFCCEDCNSLLRHKLWRVCSVELHNCTALKSKYKWNIFPLEKWLSLKKNISPQSLGMGWGGVRGHTFYYKILVLAVKWLCQLFFFPSTKANSIG